MKKLFLAIKNQPPGRLITLGFALAVLIGTLLLLLPVSIREGASISFIDALFTSTSAICVTGLIAIDTADHFSLFGQAVVACLIQTGGLGVTSVGIGFILAAGKRVGIKGRLLIKESLNVDSFRGMVRLVKAVLIMTLCFEAVGACLSFIVFSEDFPPLQALWISVFHSVAAFNNSGFDLLGGYRNLIPYRDSVLLNLTTSGLIIFGGIGFLVILDIIRSRCRFKRLSFHSKAVLSSSAALLVAGTVLLKLTTDISWMGAFFHSVSARTAGFSTYPVGEFSDAALFITAILMFIGASPGSTGGGIKTSTFFVLMQQVRSIFTKRSICAFRRGISGEAVSRASAILLLSLLVISAGTVLLCILEPEYSFLQLMFEIVSAFGTVGLSAGITPELGILSKLIVIMTMFIGRLGAFTLLSVWIERPKPSTHFTEELISVG